MIVDNSPRPTSAAASPPRTSKPARKIAKLWRQVPPAREAQPQATLGAHPAQPGALPRRRGPQTSPTCVSGRRRARHDAPGTEPAAPPTRTRSTSTTTSSRAIFRKRGERAKDQPQEENRQGREPRHGSAVLVNGEAVQFLPAPTLREHGPNFHLCPPPKQRNYDPAVFELPSASSTIRCSTRPTRSSPAAARSSTTQPERLLQTRYPRPVGIVSPADSAWSGDPTATSTT